MTWFGLVFAVAQLALAVAQLAEPLVPVPGDSAVGALFLPFCAGATVWLFWTRRLRQTLGDEEGLWRYSWAQRTASIALAIGICSARSYADSQFLERPERMVLAAILRLTMAAVLVVLIRESRADVRGVLAGTIVPYRRPIRAPISEIRYDTVQTTGVAPADDAFWRSAGTLARDARADLPLLETTRSLARRWFLVPASGEVAELRGRLSPGAVLTLFPTPPAVSGLAEPARAAEYYGLLQAVPGAPILFRLVLPSRVADFLATARGAHRAALYLPADPTARTAVTPAAEQPT